jgi:DNA-binding NarL/FixJ family response regulator
MNTSPVRGSPLTSRSHGASSLVALERRRWRPTARLLTAAAVVLLGADLAWTNARLVWTIGVLLGWLWAAILVQLVLSFPEGRPWAAVARVVVPAAYAAAVGGQVVVAFASSKTHAANRAQEIVALVVGVAVLGLVAARLPNLQVLDDVELAQEGTTLRVTVRDNGIGGRMLPTHTDEGLRAAREIHAQYPDIAVLVLSQHLEPEYALRLVEEKPAGAGYLLKERVGRVEQLLDAIERVAAGECVVDRAVVDELLARPRRADPIEELSPREREILALMAEGRSNQGICRALWLSPKTVETHIRGAFTKLGIAAAQEDNRRVLAVLAYLHRAQ